MNQEFQRHLGAEKYAKWCGRVAKLNGQIRSHGVISYNGWASLTTGYSYQEYFDWDMYFENLYLSYWGVFRYARNNLEMFLERQLESGFITKTLRNDNPTSHFKPFAAQIALLYSRQSGCYTWLVDKYYNRLKKYLNCWFWHYDMDKNGLCVWTSADHTGMDNQEHRAGSFHSYISEGVDLNCYLYRELLAMSIIARELSHFEDEKHYSEHAAGLARLIGQTFWDEEDRFFYDRNERTGEHIRVKTIAGFTPLWTGLATPEQAKHLVDEHLTNPDEFWLDFPVATWAKNEEGFYQDRITNEANWRGPCWAPTNYMIFQGLRRYGYQDLAKELAYRSMDMALHEDDTREYYNSQTGSGMGLNPFWGWSSLLYFMPLEYELGYDPTDLYRTELLPIGEMQLGYRFDPEDIIRPH